MSIKEVGTVKKELNESILRWQVGSFSVLPKKEGSRIWSPEIKKSDSDFVYHLRKIQVPKGSVGLIFDSGDLEKPMNKHIRFGVADERNSIINFVEAEWIEKHDYHRNGYFIVPELFKQSEFISRIRLFCELINKEHHQTANVSTNKEHIWELETTVKVVESKGSASNESKTCSCSPDEDKNQKLKKKNAVVKIEAKKASTNNDTEKSSCQPKEDMDQKLKNLRKLSQNFEELYLGGENTDVIIKVKEREFKVHKLILSTRSSVFKAMFTHGLSESNSGIVPIEDCEHAVFEEFLFFVYTGRVQQLSSENACQLYYVADKYQMLELKEECVSFLKKSITNETICDIICLSIKCNETELLNLAIECFARNMKEILMTVKWQLFLKENPTESNELILKALDLGFVKKKI